MWPDPSPRERSEGLVSVSGANRNDGWGQNVYAAHRLPAFRCTRWVEGCETNCGRMMWLALYVSASARLWTVSRRGAVTAWTEGAWICGCLSPTTAGRYVRDSRSGEQPASHDGGHQQKAEMFPVSIRLGSRTASRRDGVDGR